jgi:hypothetical protein
LQWIIDNASWIFSGVGIVIFMGLGYLVKRYLERGSQGQNQSADHGSLAIQAGRDVQLGKNNKKESG